MFAEQAINSINPQEPLNIIYKKVALAIEQDAPVKFPANQARQKTWVEQQKRSIISALTGLPTVNSLIKKKPTGKFVIFPNGLRARF